MVKWFSKLPNDFEVGCLQKKKILLKWLLLTKEKSKLILFAKSPKFPVAR